MAALLAVLSAGLWGASDFAGGLASRRLPAVVVVGWSQVSALVAVLLLASATGTAVRPGPWLPWGLAAGLVGASGLVCFYQALSIGTMGVVSPIAALGAVVPLVLGLAQGQRLSALQAAGVVLALLGAVAASGPELSGHASGRSIALAVVAGALFGLTLAFLAQGATSSVLLTAGAMRTMSLILFGGAALLRRSAGGIRPAQVPALAAIGIGDVCANMTFAYASTLGLSSIVAVLGSLYPVVTVLLARVVLGERLRTIQVLGVGLALGGVALLSGG